MATRQPFCWMMLGGARGRFGGNGSSGLDRTQWPWKRTWKMLGENHSFITLFCFFLKFQPVMLAFTIVFLLTPFVPRWALLGLKKMSTNIDLAFHGGCVASSLNITIIFFACQVKNPSDKKLMQIFFGEYLGHLLAYLLVVVIWRQL